MGANAERDLREGLSENIQAKRVAMFAFDPVSGTWVRVTASPSGAINIASPGGGPITIGGTIVANQGTPAVQANRWPVFWSNGTTERGLLADPIRIDPTGTTRQPTSLSGATGAAPTIVVIGLVATLITASDSTRQEVLIYNDTINTVYIGYTAAVTTLTGIPLASGATLVEDHYTGSIFGVAAVAGQVRVQVVTT